MLLGAPALDTGRDSPLPYFSHTSRPAATAGMAISEALLVDVHGGAAVVVLRSWLLDTGLDNEPRCGDGLVPIQSILGGKKLAVSDETSAVAFIHVALISLGAEGQCRPCMCICMVALAVHTLLMMTRSEEPERMDYES